MRKCSPKDSAMAYSSVERIEHLDRHKHRQAQGRRLHLALREVVARPQQLAVVVGVRRPLVEVEGITAGREGPHREVLPLRTLIPRPQLLEGHRLVSVPGEIDTQEGALRKPNGEYAHRGEPHVDADHNVAKQHPLVDKPIVRLARRLPHDIQIGRVEAQGCARQCQPSS
eukprot:scaffold3127_cov202-Prasinococcus_capsulatus_cf.AAC.9